MKEKILVILGPTATGKTDLGLDLAKKFNGELVAADSRQVYKGLDIGTGKKPNQISKIKYQNGLWEINRVKVWMYDVVSPSVQYTVADFIKDATQAVDNIVERRKLPIVVGGTGFYLKALLGGLSNLSIPINRSLREKLSDLSMLSLQERLQELSFQRWKNLNPSDRQNKRRLVRAIELVMGQSEGEGFEGLGHRCNVLKIGLTAPRQVLYERVDERVVARIDQGMIEEAKQLKEWGLSLSRMRSLGLEYKVLANYLDEKINNKDELMVVMQGQIHGYVRRQQTWFKRDPDILWFDITDQDYFAQVDNKISTWYHQANDAQG